MADAVAEPMIESTGFGGVEGTYIPSIDGPREGADTGKGADTGEAGESSEQSSETDGQQEQAEETEQPSYSKDPVLNQLIGKFAKDHPNLDPATPEGLKILNRMANQEKYIRELKTKAQPQDGLTEFERSILKPADQTLTQQPAATEQRTSQTQAVPGAQPYFDGDPGVAWKSPADAYTQLAGAWSKEGGPDYRAISDIELGIFHRRASESGYVRADQVQNLIEQRIQKELGDVLPHVRESVQDQRSERNKESVLAGLEKESDWAGVRDLEKEIDGEPPLEYGGQQFPNTLLNRILIENPEILDIQVRHKDGDIAEKLTYAARYKAAMRISKKGQFDSSKAKQILEAGTRMAERSGSDRTRQAINGGRTGTGLPSGKKTGSLVHDLVNDGGPRSFADL